MGRASDKKVASSNPGSPGGATELHVEVSLNKILNPKIAPDVQLAHHPSSWRLIQGGLRP